MTVTDNSTYKEPSGDKVGDNIEPFCTEREEILVMQASIMHF